MRTSAFTAAILALTTFTTTLCAQDDFTALLADLSFGDVPSINVPLAVAKNQAPEDLKPLPTGILMPGMVESGPQDAPQVALQDPIPATTPDPVDFDAVFALQNVQTAQPEIPSQVVGHIHNRCDVPVCDSVITCTPRMKPNLSSSTFLQYFRSNKCYTNVWDGYNQHCGKNHTHLHGDCDCFNKGSKQSGCRTSSAPGCDRNDCVSCDGGCDR